MGIGSFQRFAGGSLSSEGLTLAVDLSDHSDPPVTIQSNGARMRRTAKLTPQQLYNRCDPDQFGFETTADLQELSDVLGQPRAVEAIKFGNDQEIGV
jgi:hypothetical protein